MLHKGLLPRSGAFLSVPFPQAEIRSKRLLDQHDKPKEAHLPCAYLPPDHRRS